MNQPLHSILFGWLTLSLVSCSNNTNFNDPGKQNSHYLFWKGENGETKWLETSGEGDWLPNTGTMIEFHDNGKMQISTEYVDGDPNGQIKAWNKNGFLILNGILKNNRPFSDFELFNQSGKLFSRIIIRNCYPKKMEVFDLKKNKIMDLNFVQAEDGSGSFLSGNQFLAFSDGTPRIIYKNGYRFSYNNKGEMIEKFESREISVLHGVSSLSLFTHYLKQARTSDIIVINPGCSEGDCNNGYGIYIDNAGTQYQGKFTDGLLNGRGEIRGIDGKTIYVGEFKNGSLAGHGKLYASEYTYDGEFKNDLFNGYGLKIYNDGNKYEGNFLNDKEHGAGKLVLSDGSIEMGLWENGDQIK